MTFILKTIALYSHDGEIRHVPFERGLNIVTGQSNRGKSALLSIVEYCLGRSTFMVPDGRIRESVAWYALVLEAENGQQVLIAKPAPARGAESQSRVYFESGTALRLPDMRRLSANSNDDSLERWLSQRSGISPNLHLPTEHSTRAPLEASIKHTAYYLFQGQSLVANKDLLFHRQNEQFIPQAIRDTLPYFLGAVREDRLAITQALREARRRLAALQRQRDEAGSGASVRLSRGRTLLEEAKQVGALPPETKAETAAEIIENLRSALEWNPATAPSFDDGRIDALRQQVEALRGQLRDKDDQIAAAQAFAHEAEGFSSELSEQVWRLRSISLFRADVSECPVCATPLTELIPQAEDIRNSLKALDSGLDSVVRERPRLREHIESLSSDRNDMRAELEQKRLELEALAAEQAAFEEMRDANIRVARVLGRVSYYLETVRASDERSSPSRELAFAEGEVSRLEGLASDDESDDRLSSVMSRISSRMTMWAQTLGLEYQTHPYRLAMDKLTVVADKEDHPVPMYRMGGGQNWLGCHLIALLALHHVFVKLQRPVPRFLMLDQPSQVYFASPDVYRSLGGTTSATLAADADMVAVRRMFRFLFDVSQDLGPHFQIIVMEHANIDNDWFQKSMIEEPWAGDPRDARSSRGPAALIPSGWPEG